MAANNSFQRLRQALIDQGASDNQAIEIANQVDSQFRNFKNDAELQKMAEELRAEEAVAYDYDA